MNNKTAAPQVGVIGLGNWGTALANHLAMKGLHVLGWCREESIQQSINQSNRNALFLSEVQLDPKLRATNTLAEVLSLPFVVLAVPSAVLSLLVPQLTLAEGSILISAVKGFEAKSLLTPLQFAKQALPQNTLLAVLSGPSFARDVVHKRPCGIVAASESAATARKVAKLFSSDSMKVFVSTDTIGVELGGIVKNVIALAAGVSDGLGFGDSARAGLITRGLAEIMRLATAMGGDMQTLAGLSGLGDLVMTASSATSRNYTVGYRLGKGEKLGVILQSLGSVAEGVTTTPLVIELASRHNVQMPITAHVQRLLTEDISAQDLVQSLLTTPLTREFR